MTAKPHAVLVIGGHDSSGRAGVDADREALAALEIEPHVVVTAWTEQGAAGVTHLGPVDPARWLDEARRALPDDLRAVKFGLLPGADHAEAAARLLAELNPNVAVVVDPVLGASSGERFLSREDVPRFRRELETHRVIWTPNVPELAELVGADLAELSTDPKRRPQAARALLESGGRAVVVKGGHGLEDPVRDLVVESDGESSWIERPRLAGPGIRGSGCRFASYLAGRLARGDSLLAAAGAAGEWVAEKIRAQP